MINKLQEYVKKNDIAFIILLAGLFLTSFINYAFIISIIAAFFIKDDK